jgi:hypothetical protein
MKQKKLLEALAMMKPTSKAQLKQQCLYLSRLDVDKAERMYDFLVKDMQGIPDIEPEQRSFMDNFGERANGIVGWLRDNQDMIGQGMDFLRSIISKRKGPAVPPGNPLPPING